MFRIRLLFDPGAVGVLLFLRGRWDAGLVGAIVIKASWQLRNGPLTIGDGVDWWNSMGLSFRDQDMPAPDSEYAVCRMCKFEEHGEEAICSRVGYLSVPKQLARAGRRSLL